MTSLKLSALIPSQLQCSSCLCWLSSFKSSLTRSIPSVFCWMVKKNGSYIEDVPAIWLEDVQSTKPSANTPPKDIIRASLGGTNHCFPVIRPYIFLFGGSGLTGLPTPKNINNKTLDTGNKSTSKTLNTRRDNKNNKTQSSTTDNSSQIKCHTLTPQKAAEMNQQHLTPHKGKHKAPSPREPPAPLATHLSKSPPPWGKLEINPWEAMVIHQFTDLCGPTQQVVGTRCVDGRVPNCLLGGVGGGVGGNWC